MPKPQLYFVRNGKTYREMDNGDIYIFDGVASNPQKSMLTTWLKGGLNAGHPIPHPWRLEGDDIIESAESTNMIPENVVIENNLETIFDEIERPKVVQEFQTIKPLIYNIKQVPDDRRRSGYTEYRRM